MAADGELRILPGRDVGQAEWRALRASDTDAVLVLTQRCLDADGGHPEMAAACALAACETDAARASQGVFTPEGLAAYATVRGGGGSAECRIQIDPAFRGRGLEGELLDWSFKTVAQLHDSQAGVTVATEGLTDETDRLYRAHGFVQVFAEDVMRLALPAELPAIPTTAELTFVEWSETEPGEFFQVYEAAFRERPGFPGWSAARWTAWATEGDEFLPQLSLVARAFGDPVGFIICAGGWVVQMGVHPNARQRGVGRLILTEAVQRFQALGASEVWLDVNVNNPSAASLYASLGFETVGRRARYALAPGSAPVSRTEQ